MKFEFDATYLGKFDSVVINDFVPCLWVGETMVLTLTPESWITGCFSGFATSEERLESEVNTNSSLLNNLRMDFVKGWSGLTEFLGVGLLVVQTDRLFRGFPKRFLLVDELIVKPTAFFENLFKKGLLAGGWIDTVLECFTHIFDYSLKMFGCQSADPEFPDPGFERGMIQFSCAHLPILHPRFPPFSRPAPRDSSPRPTTHFFLSP